MWSLLVTCLGSFEQYLPGPKISQKSTKHLGKEANLAKVHAPPVFFSLSLSLSCTYIIYIIFNIWYIYSMFYNSKSLYTYSHTHAVLWLMLLHFVVGKQSLSTLFTRFFFWISFPASKLRKKRGNRGWYISSTLWHWWWHDHGKLGLKFLTAKLINLGLVRQ